MQWLKKIIDIGQLLQSIDKETRKQLWLINLILFIIFFSYPIIRSTVDATFLDLYGASRSPHVWIYSVIFLTAVVSLYNYLYRHVKVHWLFFWTTMLTIISLIGAQLLIHFGHDIYAYPLYIIKETYIVLLFHMTLGWLNSAIDFNLAKLLYGPIGAVNSLSGIIGGYCTSAFTYYFSTSQILIFGSLTLIIAAVAFIFLSDAGSMKVEEEKDRHETPFKAIAKVQRYIFWMGLVILLTQFAINLANFKFFVLLDEAISDKLLKTRYLGNIYSSINVLSLLLQLLVLPIALRIFKNRSLHIFIPVCYILATFIGYFMAGNYLLAVAATFVVFKGFDYSIFSTAKELLYFPLSSKQKYGAKYIIDMVVYRFGKGVISFLLGYQLVKDQLDYLLILFLVLWLFALVPMFNEMKKIIEANKGEQK